MGYFAYFKLLNGFKKTLYWTKEQCEAHGRRYSKAYDKLWSSDFDAMAQKTVLKRLLSKYAPMSVDLQKAVTFDQSVVKDDGTPEYVDNPENDQKEETERPSVVAPQLDIDIPDIGEEKQDGGAE